MIPILNLLEMGADVASLQYENLRNILHVRPENTTLHVTDTFKSMKQIYKDPDATKQIGVDWTDWLGSASISTSTWETDPATTDLTIANDTADLVSTVAYVSGGTLTNTYYVKNTIVTDDSTPRTECRTLQVKIVRTG